MTKNYDIKSHIMELPRLIEIGEGNIDKFGGFLRSLGKIKSISMISGNNVQSVLGKRIEDTLESNGIKFTWYLPEDVRIESIERIWKMITKINTDMIVGMGGGRAVDTAKMISHKLDRPFVSLPTAASHDGMASPFVSIKSNKPHSIMASTPMGVFVDIDVIKKAPVRLLASGCGDLVANMVAVRDWQIGHKRNGEYYGIYSSNLAMMSAKIVMENADEFAENGIDARVVVEGLISAGVASCIAGSSRPCSGSEHLFSHALDKIAPAVGLHGEKCGLGSIMMAKLQGQDWENIAKTLRAVGAPTTAAQIGIKDDDVVEALTIAQELRPERHTILKEVNMTKERATRLAKSVNII